MSVRWILALVAACAVSAAADSRDLRQALAAAAAAHAKADEAALNTALIRVVDEDGAKAAKGLLELLARGAEPAGPYWQVIYALGALEDAGAIRQLERFLEKNAGVPAALDLVGAWSGNGSPALEDTLTDLLRRKKTPAPLKLVLTDRLAERATPSAVETLLELWADHEDDVLFVERLRAGLAGLLGDDMGSRANFQSFWEQNRERALPMGEEAGATGTALDGVDPTRRAGLETLTRRGGRVLVLKGKQLNYDHIEQLLARMKLKHEVLLKEAFMADMEAALEGTAVILLNCNVFTGYCVCPTCKPGEDLGRGPTCGGCDVHEMSEGDKLSEAAVARLKAFVEQGGAVFSEDYGMWELVQPAWPTLLQPGTMLDEQEVDYALPPGAAGDPLLRGVIQREGRTVTFADRRWTIDALSPAIRILDEEKVRVLLSSKTLGGSEAAERALAVVIEPTRPTTGRPRTGGGEPRGGMLLHVLSHFGKQTRQADEYALQNLLLNFVLEAQARYARRAR